MNGEHALIDILNKDGTVRCTKCLLEAERYSSNGNIALEATCSDRSVTSGGEPCEPGEEWGTLTVNTDTKLAEDEVSIKDYSEGEGNLRTLVDAGIVFPNPVYYITSGFVQIPVCRLTAKGLALVTDRGKGKK